MRGNWRRSLARLAAASPAIFAASVCLGASDLRRLGAAACRRRRWPAHLEWPRSHGSNGSNAPRLLRDLLGLRVADVGLVGRRMRRLLPNAIRLRHSDDRPPGRPPVGPSLRSPQCRQRPHMPAWPPNQSLWPCWELGKPPKLVTLSPPGSAHSAQPLWPLSWPPAQPSPPGRHQTRCTSVSGLVLDRLALGLGRVLGGLGRLVRIGIGLKGGATHRCAHATESHTPGRH